MSYGIEPKVRTASREEANKIEILSNKIKALFREEDPDPSVAMNALFTCASHMLIIMQDPVHDEKAVETFRQNIKSMRILMNASQH